MSWPPRARHVALASQARWMEAMGEHDEIMDAFEIRDSRRAGEVVRQRDLGAALSFVAALKPRSSKADGAPPGDDH
jgi:DNA-binding GntR family transcriptional regulator